MRLKETMIKRLFNLYDDIFNKLKLEIYTDELGTIYGKWFDKNEKLIFSRNHFGTLWVDDCDSYTTLWIYSKALSLNKEEFELSLIDYLNLKYQKQSKNRPIKSIGDEKHCLEEMEYETENLQETIRRILREELYSPAGEEITPNKIVVHKSNPMFRDRILEEGLKVRVGECYQIYVNREQRDPDEIKCKPVIFATNSKRKKDWFDSTYDDDIWMINTECAGVNWFKDKHYDNDYHIVTLEDISPDCLKLIHKGTGESEDLIQESKKDKKITCDNCGWSWKLSEGGDDPYTCHKCWNENQLQEVELTEKCWPGYTQKGMKTMFGKRHPNCVKKKKTLKEWYATRDREKEMGMSYVKFEEIINNLMGKKFPWWKKLEVESINYSGLDDVVTIYGTLIIDRQWGKKEWKKNSRSEFWAFPDNFAWDNEDMDEDITRYEDFMTDQTIKEVSDYLVILFTTITNFHKTERVRLGVLKIKFV